MKKLLQITSSTTAKELNPLGNEPVKYKGCNPSERPTVQWSRWGFAEDNRKEYRIIGCIVDEELVKPDMTFTREEDVFLDAYPINSKVEAECNDEDLTAIIL